MWNMTHLKHLCLFLLVGILSSCHSNYTENVTILKAERLLYVSPDSAFVILNKMKNLDKLSKADKAAWCLHYTHAQYKLQKQIKSDSLIKISISYYSNRDLPKYSGTAWYLLGCIYSSQNKKEKAVLAFKKAEDILKETNENGLKGLVDFNIGYTSMQDQLYSHSLNYFRKSLKFFDLSKNDRYKAYAYREIANMYNQKHYPFDSVFHYLSLASNLSKEVGDSMNYYDILISKGELLLEKDCYRSKEYILKAYNHFPEYKPFYAAYLADAYSKLGKQDSANYYLNISLSDKTSSPYKIIGLHAAALIAKSKNDYKSAYEYLNKSYILRDSTYQQNMQSQLYRIDKQFDLTQKDAENAQLKIGKRNMVIWIAILIIGGLSILILFLLRNSRHKRESANNEIEKQKFKFEAEKTQIKNTQKRALLGIRLHNKIDNTLQFNKFRRGYLQKEKLETFIQEVANQSIISEKEWPDYVKEVDYLSENKLTFLKQEYSELTLTDLIVIALISLKVNISDACSLLDMSKNTMYTRRRTIKVRIGLDDNIDLEKWIDDYVSKETS